MGVCLQGRSRFSRRRRGPYTLEPAGLADIFSRSLPLAGPADFPTRLPPSSGAADVAVL